MPEILILPNYVPLTKGELIGIIRTVGTAVFPFCRRGVKGDFKHKEFAKIFPTRSL